MDLGIPYRVYLRGSSSPNLVAAWHFEGQLQTVILCPLSVQTEQRYGPHVGGPNVSSKADQGVLVGSFSLNHVAD